jgi:ABC-type Mn2+/Zn2+ transport system permease subunit
MPTQHDNAKQWQFSVWSLLTITAVVGVLIAWRRLIAITAALATVTPLIVANSFSDRQFALWAIVSGLILLAVVGHVARRHSLR